MKNQIRVVDGFVWLLVTNKAKQLLDTGLFELYVIYEDGSEGLVLEPETMDRALECGLEIGIEVGWLPED